MEPCNQNLSNDKVPLPKGINIQFNASTGKQNPYINKVKQDDKLSLVSNNIKPIIIQKMNGTKSSKIPVEINCDSSESQELNSTESNTSRLARIGNDLPNLIIPNHSQSNHSSPLPLRYQNSFKYGRPIHLEISPPVSYLGRLGTETPSQISKMNSDTSSYLSWTSVGLGSTDGKKMIVRKVPTSPEELFNIVNPPT